MSQRSEEANAVVWAVEKILDLYGVQHTREQSRVVMVEGAAGRFRPMYFGKWVDDNGMVHTSGRADILARPKITIAIPWPADYVYREGEVRTPLPPSVVVSVPLWIECKSGAKKASAEQRFFAAWVKSNGDHYLLIRDDTRPLEAWLQAHGVRKEPKRIVNAEPLTTEALDGLECRHCGELKTQHTGAIHACRGKKALGKVWSPSLKVRSKEER